MNAEDEIPLPSEGILSADESSRQCREDFAKSIIYQATDACLRARQSIELLRVGLNMRNENDRLRAELAALKRQNTELRHELHRVEYLPVHSESEALAPDAGRDYVPREELEKVIDAEQGRWQHAIYELICKRCPGESIDGKGCDSGDPLDFTLTEISQGINYWNELADELAKALGEINDLEFKEFTRSQGETFRIAHEALDRYRKAVRG